MELHKHQKHEKFLKKNWTLNRCGIQRADHVHTLEIVFCNHYTEEESVMR